MDAYSLGNCTRDQRTLNVPTWRFALIKDPHDMRWGVIPAYANTENRTLTFRMANAVPCSREGNIKPFLSSAN